MLSIWTETFFLAGCYKVCLGHFFSVIVRYPWPVCHVNRPFSGHGKAAYERAALKHNIE